MDSPSTGNVGGGFQTPMVVNSTSHLDGLFISGFGGQDVRDQTDQSSLDQMDIQPQVKRKTSNTTYRQPVTSPRPLKKSLAELQEAQLNFDAVSAGIEGKTQAIIAETHALQALQAEAKDLCGRILNLSAEVATYVSDEEL